MTNHMVSCIAKPTLTAHLSATFIDTIYLSFQQRVITTSGIIMSDFSDHLPIFISFSNEDNTKQKKGKALFQN